MSAPVAALSTNPAGPAIRAMVAPTTPPATAPFAAAHVMNLVDVNAVSFVPAQHGGFVISTNFSRCKRFQLFQGFISPSLSC
jgi:hypothetical protein